MRSRTAPVVFEGLCHDYGQGDRLRPFGAAEARDRAPTPRLPADGPAPAEPLGPLSVAAG